MYVITVKIKKNKTSIEGCLASKWYVVATKKFKNLWHIWILKMWGLENILNFYLHDKNLFWRVAFGCRLPPVPFGMSLPECNVQWKNLQCNQLLQHVSTDRTHNSLYWFLITRKAMLDACWNNANCLSKNGKTSYWMLEPQMIFHTIQEICIQG